MRATSNLGNARTTGNCLRRAPGRQSPAFVAASRAPDFQREDVHAAAYVAGNDAPLSANAQRDLGASQWNVAMSRPASRSHAFSVWPPDAETARFPSGATVAPRTSAAWPSSVCQRAGQSPGGSRAGLSVPAAYGGYGGTACNHALCPRARRPAG